MSRPAACGLIRHFFLGTESAMNTAACIFHQRLLQAWTARSCTDTTANGLIHLSAPRPALLCRYPRILPGKRMASRSPQVSRL